MIPVRISPRPVRATGRVIAASTSLRGAVRSVFWSASAVAFVVFVVALSRAVDSVISL